MKKLYSICLIMACGLCLAEDILLPTRYVKTTWMVNTETGATWDEKSKNVTARSKLSISKIKKDDTELIWFESKKRQDNDRSEISRDSISLEGGAKLIAALKQYQDLCRVAARKGEDSGEIVFSENDIILTFNSKDRGHKNFFELTVEDIVYVINSQILVTKLIAIISPMIGEKSLGLK